MAGETRAAAEAVAELSRGSVGRGGRHGIESVTDVLLSFQSARRSFGDLATVVDRDHVPLRTAVMLTGHERHALTSWFNPEIAADELRYGARRSRLALAYFCGRAATFVPDELHEGGDAAGISGVRRKPAPYVTLPLAHGGRVAGVVQFGCRCALTEHDLAFFDDLARWLGILVSRARRTRLSPRPASADRARSLARPLSERARFLGDAASLLGGALLGTRGAMQEVTRLVARRVADGCVIDLVGVDEDGSKRFACAPRTDPSRLASAVDRVAAAVMLAGTTVVSREETAYHDDPSRLDVVAFARDCAEVARQELGAAWLACVPIRARGRTTGTATLFSTSRADADLDDELVATFARQIGLAVANVAAFEEVRRDLAKRDTVLAMVSHDLRNPLGAVLLNVQRVLASMPEVDRRRNGRAEMAAIERAARRAARLIQDLLDTSELAHGALRVERRRQEVGALVREVVDLYQPVAAAAKVGLRLTIASPPLEADVDGDRLVQVLSNLVGNAIKFTPASGTVLVVAEARGGSVEVAVTDTGVGIAPVDLPHVFSRFWRAGTSRSAGLGLGLSIARDLVRAHGGEIEVESAPGKGSTFRVVLPS